MLYSAFFEELFSSVVISAGGLLKYQPFLEAHAKGQLIEFPKLDPLQMSLFDAGGLPVGQSGSILDFDPNKIPENSVAVIPIHGTLTRAGSWMDYGTEEIAAMLEQAFKAENVKAIVLHTNSGGGTTDSTFPIKAVMQKKNKPIYGVIDSNAFSAAYLAILYADKIWAVDQMAEMGSIGVKAVMMDDSEMYKEYGIKVIKITPPESKWKGKAEDDAMKGKPQQLIEDKLTPWAKHFQDLVRANRPNLDESVEGTLEGRTFFAQYGEVNGMANGLIDGIKTMEKAIQYASGYTTRKLLANI
jgi:protease-4